MLLWIIVALLVVSIIASIIIYNCCSYPDWLGLFVGVLLAIAIIASVISGICLMAEYIGLDGDVAAYHQRYDMLVAQAENAVYDDKVEGFSKFELVNAVQKWNEDLARGKTLQHDFWVGPYVADVYDQFSYIDPIFLANCEKEAAKSEESK